jgi:hypothetical protein
MDSIPTALQRLYEDCSDDEAAWLAEEAPNWTRIPPTIEQFVLDDFYLGQTDFCCDAVLRTLREVFDPARGYREAALVWGIGAGKSYASSIALAYMAYCLLCLKDPQGYYGLAPGSEIAVVNFSVTATQAKRVVFDEVLARIEHAPCFDAEGFRRDEQINSELRWPEKGIIIFPGNSQAESAIGYNVIAAVVDEASWLPDVAASVRVAGRSANARYDAAEELYNAIAKRIKSRGNDRWQRDARFLMISSPRYVGDFMERKFAEAEHKAHVYATRLPTWEGPSKRRLSGAAFEDAKLGPVPVEYREDFERDPERARRDLGARPSEAIDAFFTDTEALAACYDAHLPHILAGPLTLATVPDHEGIAREVTFDATPRFAHIDLALKHDRAGLAIVHREAVSGDIVADLVTYLALADFDGAEEIDLEAIRTLLLRLAARGMRFQMVSYDGFQSADSRQLLRKAGIPTALHSVDRNTESYDTLKEWVYAGRVRIPETERARVFEQEARRLELVAGKKIDHPRDGSKDVADALAGAVAHAGEGLVATAVADKARTRPAPGFDTGDQIDPAKMSRAEREQHERHGHTAGKHDRARKPVRSRL